MNILQFRVKLLLESRSLNGCVFFHFRHKVVQLFMIELGDTIIAGLSKFGEWAGGGKRQAYSRKKEGKITQMHTDSNWALVGDGGCARY